MTALVGFHMPNFTFPGTPDGELFERAAGLAERAEQVGFDLLTVMDHQYQIAVIGPEEDPMLEPYAVLSALAMRTSRVRLGTLVTGVTYRNPALLAKTVTTLDIISGGRAVYGIGAAWNEDEHRGYNFAFPPIRERMDRLEEAIQIAQRMFSDRRASFEGRYSRVDNALNNPKPIQPDGPPILVGGGGEQRTLRIVAKYADWSNWFGHIPDLQRKHELLDGYCEQIGRDPASILRTVTLPLLLVESEAEGRRAFAAIDPARRGILPPGTPEQLAERVRAYLAAGFGGVIFRTVRPTTPEWIDMAAEVIRLIR